VIIINAVHIEHAFSMLIGEGRGGLNGLIDADWFRRGNVQKIGELFQETANMLESRIRNMEFQDWEKEAGKPYTRLMHAINSLRDIGRTIVNRENDEDNDYHWKIIGELIQIIASLLDHIEGRTLW